MNRRLPQSGFTLLEVLIAISIFAMIGLASNQVLRTVIDAQAATDKSSERLLRMQRVYLALSLDMRQVIDRPVRDQYGDESPPVLIPRRGYAVELTRTGWRNPLGKARSNLQRVAYELDGDVLLRHFWTVLDRAQDTEPRTQTVLRDVESLQVRMLDPAGGWHSTWPPARRGIGSGDEEQEASALPAAIELKLVTPDFGELRWVFEVAG